MAVEKLLYLSCRKPIKMNTNKPFHEISLKMDIGEIANCCIIDIWLLKCRCSISEDKRFLRPELRQKRALSFVINDDIPENIEFIDAGKQMELNKKYQPADVLAGILVEAEPLTNSLYTSMEGKSAWN